MLPFFRDWTLLSRVNFLVLPRAVVKAYRSAREDAECADNNTDVYREVEETRKIDLSRSGLYFDGTDCNYLPADSVVIRGRSSARGELVFDVIPRDGNGWSWILNLFRRKMIRQIIYRQPLTIRVTESPFAFRERFLCGTFRAREIVDEHIRLDWGFGMQTTDYIDSIKTTLLLPDRIPRIFIEYYSPLRHYVISLGMRVSGSDLTSRWVRDGLSASKRISSSIINSEKSIKVRIKVFEIYFNNLFLFI